MYRNFTLYFFFAQKNMKKTPSKVGYFSKIGYISWPALMAQSALKPKKYKVQLSFYST